MSGKVTNGRDFSQPVLFWDEFDNTASAHHLSRKQEGDFFGQKQPLSRQSLEKLDGCAGSRDCGTKHQMAHHPANAGLIPPSREFCLSL
ncbi:MAG: hypothetical protein PHV34_23300 [Verrucomicrobiae bacterium]|nr:hypothetical protein [Verrucomicrobiae bacterium]